MCEIDREPMVANRDRERDRERRSDRQTYRQCRDIEIGPEREREREIDG